MIQIPQHGAAGELFDMKTFIPWLEGRLSIETWEFSVQECVGDGFAEIEESSNSPWSGTHEQFKQRYQGIGQTIDGVFEAYSSGGVLKLEVVDSSFWIVDGDFPEIEKEFSRTFGSYRTPSS